MMIAAAGLFAPTIRYHDGTFYIACTNVGCEGSDFDASNFYIFSNDISKPDSWSDPIPLALHGIDPSLFIDPADGRAYVQGSWRLTRTEQPTSTIKQWEIDLATGKELSPVREIWEGHSRIYTEGPHMYAKDGWYYLLVAEGGTFEHHHLSLARSRSIWGPFEPCPFNPVLTSRNTTETIQDVGHGELFQDDRGWWWATVLGVRKGKGRASTRYPLGRESFLTPVSWPKDDWPTIDQPQLHFSRGLVSTRSATKIPSFTCSSLDVGDCYIRAPELDDYQWGRGTVTGSEARDVRLRASKTDLSVGTGSSTFVGQRQRRLQGAAVSTTIEIAGLKERTIRNGILGAGLTGYKDDFRFMTIGLEVSAAAEGEINVVLDVKNNSAVRRIASKNTALGAKSDLLKLMIVARGDMYEFSYQEVAVTKTKTDNTMASGSGTSGDHTNDTGKDSVLPWCVLGQVDAVEMTGRDFTGILLGLYANETGDEISDSERTWVSFKDYIIQA